MISSQPLSRCLHCHNEVTRASIMQSHRVVWLRLPNDEVTYSHMITLHVTLSFHTKEVMYHTIWHVTATANCMWDHCCQMLCKTWTNFSPSVLSSSMSIQDVHVLRLYNNEVTQLWPSMLRGAEEACWAHNPKVLGSKPSGAMHGNAIWWGIWVLSTQGLGFILQVLAK